MDACSTQALLANIAAMYAVYHGPGGLETIATRTHGLASILAAGMLLCTLWLLQARFLSFNRATSRAITMA